MSEPQIVGFSIQRLLYSHLIHRAHPNLSLGSRQPLGFRVVPENVVETVLGGLETPSRLKTGAVADLTLSSENRIEKETFKH